MLYFPRDPIYFSRSNHGTHGNLAPTVNVVLAVPWDTSSELVTITVHAAVILQGTGTTGTHDIGRRLTAIELTDCSLETIVNFYRCRYRITTLTLRPL